MACDGMTKAMFAQTFMSVTQISLVLGLSMGKYCSLLITTLSLHFNQFHIMAKFQKYHPNDDATIILDT